MWDLCGRDMSGPIVIGEVAMWGKVRRSPWLRSAFVVPRSLVLIRDRWMLENPEASAGSLASRYEVPADAREWTSFRVAST